MPVKVVKLNNALPIQQTWVARLDVFCEAVVSRPIYYWLIHLFVLQVYGSPCRAVWKKVELIQQLVPSGIISWLTIQLTEYAIHKTRYDTVSSEAAFKIDGIQF